MAGRHGRVWGYDEFTVDSESSVNEPIYNLHPVEDRMEGGVYNMFLLCSYSLRVRLGVQLFGQNDHSLRSLQYVVELLPGVS